MSSEIKVAILITDAYGEPFESIRKEFSPKLVREAQNNNIDVYFIKGKKPSTIGGLLEKISSSLRYSSYWPLQRMLDRVTLSPYNLRKTNITQIGENLLTSNREGLRTLGAKVFAGLSHLGKNYQYVIKTTNSSIFNFPVLLSAISNLEKSSGYPVYAGSIINFNTNKPFVSGANLLLNRQAIQLLEKDSRSWDHGELDDVAIGKIMRNNEIQITGLTTMNIQSLESLHEVSDSQLKAVQHFRCKSSEIPRNDLEILNALADRLSYGKHSEE